MVTSGGVLRVLIVDDEQLIADTLAMILSRAGFKAWATYSGEDAVERAAVLAPDVLVTDVVMRGLNGIEAAIQITRMQPSCKVLLFSGQATSADLLCRSEALGHHFELILKPVHPTELIERLNGYAYNRGQAEAAL